MARLSTGAVVCFVRGGSCTWAHWSPSPHLDCHCERGLRGNEPHYIRGHQPPGAHVAGPETRDPALTIVNMLLEAGGGGVDTMRVCGAGD